LIGRQHVKWALRADIYSNSRQATAHTPNATALIRGKAWPARESAIERIPLKRVGCRRTWRGAALFLTSPLASFVVGQTIVVETGLIL
jgi:NAD(P)-dependent dehydrogenase (short-subunit alcohol dehydrogenase family)